MKRTVKSYGIENHRLRACLWIVNVLERQALTFSEINKRWQADVDISGGEELVRRSFINYKNAIADLLKVVIECDVKDGYRYKIVARDDNALSEWLIRSYTAGEVLSSNADMRGRILLEEIPSGQEYLEMILDAMRTGCCLSFEFQQFHEAVGHWILEAEPYCVKLYQQRWYVLVKEWRTRLVSHEKVAEMHIYSLDRIRQMQMGERCFEIDPLYDANEFFRYAFGVRVEKGNEPEVIRLKVAAVQRKYLRTLPLHHSQREVETQTEYSIFEYHVAQTVELVMKILYYGPLVEVLAPQSLREEIAWEVNAMSEIYQSSER